MASTMRIILEVCVDSVESAIAAVDGGADRLEVCANLGLGGGTTPSLGLIRSIHAAVPDIPLMVMIRPRVGDFLYTDLELRVMLEDVIQLKATGHVSGVVFGILDSGGRVDVARSKLLAMEAHPLEVCFHRAFDMSIDASECEASLATIMVAYDPRFILDSVPGCRINTWDNQNIDQVTFRWCNDMDLPDARESGLGSVAMDSIVTLQNLLHASGSEPIAPSILVGSGVNTNTIRSIVTLLLPFGLREVHMSGGAWTDGGMEFRPNGMGMGVGGERDWAIWRTNEEAVWQVRQIIDLLTPAA